MVVLRNREILPTLLTPKPLSKCSTPEPVTPNQINEPLPSRSTPFSPDLQTHHMASNSESIRRRSLRLASKSVAVDFCIENKPRKRKSAASTCSMEEKIVIEDVEQIVDEGQAKTDDVDGNSSVVLNLNSGKRVPKRRVEYGSGDEPVTEKGTECEDNGMDVEEVTEVKRESNLGEQMEYDGGGGEDVESVIGKIEDNQNTDMSCDSSIRRRYSEEEKGKGELVDDDGSVSAAQEELNLESMVKELVDSLKGNVATDNGRQTRNAYIGLSESRMKQFRDIARKNAHRFAHFVNTEQEEALPIEIDEELPSAEENREIDDWPGPFSTAMRIVKDRERKVNSQQVPSTSEKAKSVPITWIPKSSKGSHCSNLRVPSLQELCMRIIVKNCDAVTSLEHVPDALRHRICGLLCDGKRMDSHFLDLLVQGSPGEIRIKDCSWLTEEDFLKSFKGCDTSNLTVLQLDQCGRCMTDYIVSLTLARTPGSLPALISLSVAGACRLSDIGLRSIISSAPALRSINLSQCSLLTSASIGTLADSLCLVLRELYIDDCQSLDPMLILPALEKLEYLEVLSLAGNQTVSDNFVRKFVASRGHYMKELVLSDCVKLTDSSIKVIAEACPGLRALSLVNLRKLTDFSLGYLANGCREIQTLKLCRNPFSDEAIAAFVETSGELLKELSLNNVRKVGNNTALSLAKRAKNLLSLDLSWCRNLRDEAVGSIVDSCSSLTVLKLFGCGQITDVFVEGHSNQNVQIIGLKMSPVLEHIWVPDSQEFPLRYSAAPSMQY